MEVLTLQHCTFAATDLKSKTISFPFAATLHFILSDPRLTHTHARCNFFIVDPKQIKRQTNRSCYRLYCNDN